MLDSIRAYFKSISFMRKHGLTWLFWFPIVITLLVFYSGMEITSFATDWVSGGVQSWIESSDWLGDGTGVLSSIVYWIIWLVLRITLYFLMAFVGGSLILLLMSPLLTYASALVASKMGADVPPFSIDRFFHDLARAAWLAIKNGCIQFVMTITCFLIVFIPVVGFISPILMFAIGAYFFGYNFMDYTLERKGLTVKESNQFVWKKKFKTMGLGTPFALWMLIPFIGPVTSGFVAFIATVASTINLETDTNKPLRTGL